jgi:hypothetical protein
MIVRSGLLIEHLYERAAMTEIRSLAATLSPSCRNGSNSPMAEGDPIRIIPHRGVDDDCGA